MLWSGGFGYRQLMHAFDLINPAAWPDGCWRFSGRLAFAVI